MHEQAPTTRASASGRPSRARLRRGLSAAACGALLGTALVLPAASAAAALAPLVVQPVDDVNGNGARDPGEQTIAGLVVEVTPEGGPATRSISTAAGVALELDGRAARVRVLRPDTGLPLSCATALVTTPSGTAPAECVDGAMSVPAGAHELVLLSDLGPGVVTTTVFHDLDRDGVREEGDLALAHRTVKLQSSAGAALATAYTDADGSVTFPARAGSAYRVDVLPQNPWTATAPRSGSTVLTTIPVTAPLDGTAAVVTFGHYNPVDLYAPPPPRITPGSAALKAPSLITMTTPETGGVLRYTLDGSAPTATRGMVYTTPVRISMDHVLRAVAVDVAGNVSGLAQATYDLPWSGRSALFGAGAWAVTTGGTPRGGATETTADDGRELAVGSVAIGRRPTVDLVATVPVPVGLRAAAALNVAVSQRTTLRNTRVRAQYLDTSVVPNRWRLLITQSQPLDEARVEVDLGTATKVVDGAGNLTVRLTADNAYPFDMVVDQLAVTAVNRR